MSTSVVHLPDRTRNAGRDSRTSRSCSGEAIVGTQLRDLDRAGRVRVLPSQVVATNGRVVHLADGTTLTVSSVRWCTGFRRQTSGSTCRERSTPRESPGTPTARHPYRARTGGGSVADRLNSSIIDRVDRDARAGAQRVRAHRLRR